jgi:uncharacterized protein YndB with AHSA1/START domain
VPVPPERVYAHLAVLANHAAFLDHFLVDWSFSGPAEGVGARARARANTTGSQDWTDFEIVEAEQPQRLVEDGVGNGGKRHTRGTYELQPTADGGTRISFTLEWIEASRAERICPPLTRAFIRRPNAKAMRRLAGRLGD